MPTHPGEATPTPHPLAYSLVHALMALPVAYGGGLSVEGLEHVPPGTPAVIAGNHQLALDPFVIGYAIPSRRAQVQFMTKQEAFGWPLVGPILSAVGAFPVDRTAHDTRAVRRAIRVLQGGGCVGIFPQGTRGGAEMHGGVALIALRARAPIVPVRVWHDPPRRRGWPGGHWHVRFGPPLAPAGSIQSLTLRWENAVAVLG
ncbi:lysophospholipid acyltransferase family protein [Deinococcus metallilatus]|uniref:1-acyl-sn-glycerol-3-phosphate acyltransferase n=2 Tax=Deinococcus metallilatus TaxID=1211322 RepID=A0ABR6MS06_9DEIO|nr:lysophospholipid acyltransferase family protein [Deinococcus metallilatus]MBB5294689.1 1-acyl-sn-glycerol-3-phosphate acyltransferase [Deinococcus metallilatus]GMA15906.1 1-acyl-sn-glycerol-3-phosphate acyltransferase [Deinococcus metallilatus]